MALKVKNDDNDKSSKNEDTKFKSYITKQFKKFIKNANVKASDKDHKQSGFSQFNSQDKGKKEFKDAGQSNNVLAGPKCYRCQGFGHMKQNVPYISNPLAQAKP